MGRRTSKVIVGSDDLYKKAGLLYPKKIIINSCLPLSGDFYEQLAINGTPNTNDSLGVISFDKQAPIRILFFGGITAYKGLHYLNDVISTLPAGYINVRIIGRGDLKKVAPDLYARSLNEKDVTWINRFASAEEVISELKNSDMMFAMYDSVTATSLIDIANSLGVPVLTSELPFFKSKIKDGVNGFIINRNELHEFLNSKIKDKTINKDLVFKYFRTCGVNNQCANSLIANDVVRRMK
ncbi:glycosyltransferase, group 1 family protein [Cedecea davisae DSM 4568]|uniref:Glycosyltransferase, group 1 family protein n=2 Tax=Cedecea davisae TaxID=158484 RepID=S3JS49_9ENTR|nr:glycosyltransferase, group 1 family protein [Cedecea davisae DSM 4568]